MKVCKIFFSATRLTHYSDAPLNPMKILSFLNNRSKIVFQPSIQFLLIVSFAAGTTKPCDNIPPSLVVRSHPVGLNPIPQ